MTILLQAEQHNFRASHNNVSACITIAYWTYNTELLPFLFFLASTTTIYSYVYKQRKFEKPTRRVLSSREADAGQTAVCLTDWFERQNTKHDNYSQLSARASAISAGIASTIRSVVPGVV
jgi:hypothetical protein